MLTWTAKLEENQKACVLRGNEHADTLSPNLMTAWEISEVTLYFWKVGSQEKKKISWETIQVLKTSFLFLALLLLFQLFAKKDNQ